MITGRYLKYQTGLANQALKRLMEGEDLDEGIEETQAEENKVRIHDLRLQAVRDELLQSGATRVVDLGCGEGKLLKLLLAEKQFNFVMGMDVSYRSLEIAMDRLKTDRLSPKQQERLKLIQGSLTYRDQRIEGMEAAALVEVIEHLDEPRLAALEKVLFACAKPQTIVMTTPNAEYNKKFQHYAEGQMRHADHRFEWTRAEFQSWAGRVAGNYGYMVTFKPIGEEDPEVGAISQMGIFSRNEINGTL